MSTAVAHLLSEVMLLPADSRTDLVEAILEQASPSAEFLASQMQIVTRRMDSVRRGTSHVVPVEEAHASVLANLQSRA